MKRFHIIGLVVGTLIVMFLVYYGSYRFYLYKVGDKDKEQYVQQDEGNYLEANTPTDIRITNKTVLRLEYYNRKDGTITEEEMQMPVEYIGLAREELVAYLSEYGQNPSVEDIQAGFERFQVISFSKEQLVLRKIQSPPAIVYKYFLIEENECVTVYYIDKKTVFEYTNIVVDALPNDVGQQIKRGKYIIDEDSLYDFLENYSS